MNTGEQPAEHSTENTNAPNGHTGVKRTAEPPSTPQIHEHGVQKQRMPGRDRGKPAWLSPVEASGDLVPF